MQLIECAEQALGTLFTMLDQFHHKAASAVRTAPEFNYACTMFQFLQDDLQRAKYHLAHLDFSIGIVGNVNVGKSSTLNALIGWNLSPRRNSAMTMIPCRFVNVPTQQTPILSFSMWQYFQGVLEKLRKRYKECLTLIETTDDDFARYDLEAALHNVETAQPKLLNIIADPSTAIVCNVEGEQAILQQLELLNDMVRLVHSEPFYESEAAASMLKNMSTSLDVFPIITVKFRNSSFVPENAVGTVTLIDTPGPNESDFQSAASATGGEPAIAAFLREIYQRILSQVNALIVVRRLPSDFLNFPESFSCPNCVDHGRQHYPKLTGARDVWPKGPPV
jgi:GTPase SAR1 family protein